MRDALCFIALFKTFLRLFLRHLTPGGENQLSLPALPDVHSELLHPGRGGAGSRELGPAGVAAALRPPPVGLHPAQLPGLRHVQLGQLLRHHAHLGRHAAHPGQPERGGEPAAVSAAVRQRDVGAELRRRGADAVWHDHLPELGAHRRLPGRSQSQGSKVGAGGFSHSRWRRFGQRDFTRVSAETSRETGRQDGLNWEDEGQNKVLKECVCVFSRESFDLLFKVTDLVFLLFILELPHCANFISHTEPASARKKRLPFIYYGDGSYSLLCL